MTPQKLKKLIFFEFTIFYKSQFLRKDTTKHEQEHKDQHMSLTLQHLLKTQQKAISTENALTEKLDRLDNMLTVTDSELAATKEDLQNSKDELGIVMNNLNATQTELSNAKMSLRETRLLANANKAGLVSTNQNINLNKVALTSANEKILRLETQTQEAVTNLEAVKTDLSTSIKNTKASFEQRFALHKTETGKSMNLVENRMKVIEDKSKKSEVTNVEKRGEIYKTIDSKISNIRCYLHVTFALASVGAAFMAFILYIVYKDTNSRSRR